MPSQDVKAPSQGAAVREESHRQVLADLNEHKWALGDESADARLNALQSIESRHSLRTEPVPFVLPLCRDADRRVRRQAVTVLNAILSHQYGARPEISGAPAGPYRSSSWTNYYWTEFLKTDGAGLHAALSSLADDSDRELAELAAEGVRKIDIRSQVARITLESGNGTRRERCPGGNAIMRNRSLYDVGGTLIQRFYQVQSSLTCWSFNSDGSLISLGYCYDTGAAREKIDQRIISGGIWLHDVATGERVGFDGGGFGRVNGVSFSDDDRRILVQADPYKKIQSGK